MRPALVLVVVIALLAANEARAAFLGVELQQSPDVNQPGALVHAVAPDSAAAAAGLRPGDIFVSLQRRPVTSPNEVISVVRAAAPGSRLEIEILRAGRRLPLIVAFGDPPAPAPAGHAGLPATGFAVTAKETPHCSALAPADWTMQSSPNASAVETSSADRRSYAGWGVTAVDRAQERYFGPLYGSPETSVLFLAQQIARGSLGDASAMRYESAGEPFLGYFTIHRVASAGTHGYVFYHVYPGPGPNTYIESVYFALAHKSLGPVGIAIASSVAVSLRCVTQLVPTRNDPPAPGASKGRKLTGCGRAEGNLKGYNKELGWQTVHTETGTNVILDATTPYENGPDGPGYYYQDGNFRRKYQPGRSDDC